jgi:hypothetical protein
MCTVLYIVYIDLQIANRPHSTSTLRGTVQYVTFFFFFVALRAQHRALKAAVTVATQLFFACTYLLVAEALHGTATAVAAAAVAAVSVRNTTDCCCALRLCCFS